MANDKKPRILPNFEEAALKRPDVVSQWSARRYGLGDLPAPFNTLLLKDPEAARALCRDLAVLHADDNARALVESEAAR